MIHLNFIFSTLPINFSFINKFIYILVTKFHSLPSPEKAQRLISTLTPSGFLFSTVSSWRWRRWEEIVLCCEVLEEIKVSWNQIHNFPLNYSAQLRQAEKDSKLFLLRHLITIFYFKSNVFFWHWNYFPLGRDLMVNFFLCASSLAILRVERKTFLKNWCGEGSRKGV